jgi:hypothetical protein
MEDGSLRGILGEIEVDSVMEDNSLVMAGTER